MIRLPGSLIILLWVLAAAPLSGSTPASGSGSSASEAPGALRPAFSPALLAAPAPAITASPATADTARKRKNPTGAMLRSLALPGWGQFYNQQYWKAALVVAGEAAIIASAVYYHNLYKDATTTDAQEFYLDQRNVRFWWLGAAILISMLDAYVDAHLYNFDESESLALRPHAGYGHDGFAAQASLAIRF